MHGAMSLTAPSPMSLRLGQEGLAETVFVSPACPVVGFVLASFPQFPASQRFLGKLLVGTIFVGNQKTKVDKSPILGSRLTKACELYGEHFF